MHVIRIDDGCDPRLADYAGVREPTLLRQRGLFIAEGRVIVRRLIAAGRIQPRSLLLNDAALNTLGDLLERAGTACDIFVASADVILAVTGFTLHRGCDRRPSRRASAGRRAPGQPDGGGPRADRRC
jgi:tRNA G18 (ribose-2'-O)-methylase SpoU